MSKSIKIPFLLIAATLLLQHCTVPMVKLENPDPGKKPGLVMFMVYDVQDWGNQVLTKQMSAVKISKLNGGYYEAVKTTETGLKTYGYARYVMATLEPGAVYTFRGFSSSDSYSNSYKTMSMDTTDIDNAIRITVTPGEIKFLGLIATHSQSSGFNIVDGADIFKKLQSRIYYSEMIKKELFGAYEISQKGAFKNFLDIFIEEQEEGYWKNLAEKTRKNL